MGDKVVSWYLDTKFLGELHEFTAIGPVGEQQLRPLMVIVLLLLLFYGSSRRGQRAYRKLKFSLESCTALVETSQQTNPRAFNHSRHQVANSVSATKGGRGTMLLRLDT